MTTKPSTAAWADEPFTLLRTPYLDQDVNSHYAVECASVMASAHNCLIRSLNAIMLQGPHIPTSQQEGYVEQDVRDFVYYIWAWTKMVNHHHHSEESAIFPLVEEATETPGLLAELKHQHGEFQDGLIQLQAYAALHKEKPRDYRWKEVETIVHSFGQTLVDHLKEEIGELLALKKFDSAKLKKAWLEAEKVAKNAADFSLLVRPYP